MTIKRYLFISNILMLVIPSVVSFLSFFVCFITLNAISHGMLFKALRDGDDNYPYIDAFLHMQVFIIFLVVAIAFIAIMYTTSRFLIKFVFRKIKQPLALLSNGAHEISAGNLAYRIAYEQNDEFKPVCEDFNYMAIKLKDSVEEVQKNEQNRKELLASISHELRSPLTAIKGFVEGLIDGVAATPEAQWEYLDIIRQKTDDINSMVTQIFVFSKMDMGNYPTYPEELNVGKEISDLLSVCTEEYKTKGLFISAFDLPPDAYIIADPVQLRSIFLNIMDNSAKYKEKDVALITIRCETKEGVIRVIFDDDGPGAPDDALPKLFDVFYRADPSRNSVRQGSGLGLAIAAKAAQRMNGLITAENLAVGGLRIVLEIPTLVNR
ncbi:MAG: ATP-binding protein [Firmicutes bacterium]|nr:ATP-binding protein [Bacillota bacterium]